MTKYFCLSLLICLCTLGGISDLCAVSDDEGKPSSPPHQSPPKRGASHPPQNQKPRTLLQILGKLESELLTRASDTFERHFQEGLRKKAAQDQEAFDTFILEHIRPLLSDRDMNDQKWRFLLVALARSQRTNDELSKMATLFLPLPIGVKLRFFPSLASSTLSVEQMKCLSETKITIRHKEQITLLRGIELIPESWFQIVTLSAFHSQPPHTIQEWADALSQIIEKGETLSQQVDPAYLLVRFSSLPSDCILTISKNLSQKQWTEKDFLLEKSSAEKGQKSSEKEGKTPFESFIDFKIDAWQKMQEEILKQKEDDDLSSDSPSYEYETEEDPNFQDPATYENTPAISDFQKSLVTEIDKRKHTSTIKGCTIQ